jgi:predicted transcriptional regulator
MADMANIKRHILVSIRPEYVYKILDGEKTVELRRKFPEQRAIGATALIYSSSPVSAIVGCSRIKRVLKLPISQIWKRHRTAACISKDEFTEYFTEVSHGFVIFFDGVKLFEPRLEAKDLAKTFGIVPPQSYRYLSEEYLALISNERLQGPYRY